MSGITCTRRRLGSLCCVCPSAIALRSFVPSMKGLLMMRPRSDPPKGLIAMVALVSGLSRPGPFHSEKITWEQGWKGRPISHDRPSDRPLAAPPPEPAPNRVQTDPEAISSRSRIDPDLGPSPDRPRSDLKSTPHRPRIGPRIGPPSRPQDRRLTLNRPPHRHRMGPRSIANPNRPTLDPAPMASVSVWPPTLLPMVF